MRKAAFAGLFACIVFTMANGSTASAASLDVFSSTYTIDKTMEVAVLTVADQARSETPKQPVAKPVKQTHKIKSGETLVEIAKEYKTSWKRLFYKNKSLKDPDILEVGTKISIPEKGEKLKTRKIPANVIKTARPASQSQSTSETLDTTNQSRTAMGSTAGNTYSYGYCTWYVKNRRPDLPNNLGNADTWVARAAAQGLATGSRPAKGAVGQRGMHVVYVESVNGDGTVTVSEMNHVGWNVESKRTVPASYFQYIY